MPNGDADQDGPVTPPTLKEQAARARRLAAGMSNQADRRLLNDMADELERMAAAILEKEGA